MLKYFVYSLLAITIIFVGYNTSPSAPKTSDELQYIESTHVKLPEPIEIAPVIPDIDVDELHCLAKNIYFEARGESINGKMAVANVTLNRVESEKFPNTICEVVYQARHSTWWLENKGKKVPIRNQCQFSWYCDGKSDELKLTTANGTPILPNVIAWEESLHVATSALIGNIEDITHGATHYYNPSLAQPQWAVYYQETAVIENHCFHKML